MPASSTARFPNFWLDFFNQALLVTPPCAQPKCQQLLFSNAFFQNSTAAQSQIHTQDPCGTFVYHHIPTHSPSNNQNSTVPFCNQALMRFAFTVECVNRKHNDCDCFCRRLRPKSSSHFLLLFLNDHAQKFVAEALQCIHGIRLRSNQDLLTFLVHATWRPNTSRAAASGKRPPDCSSATPRIVVAPPAPPRSTAPLSVVLPT